MYNARKNISNLTYAKINAEFATNKKHIQRFGINMWQFILFFFN